MYADNRRVIICTDASCAMDSPFMKAFNRSLHSEQSAIVAARGSGSEIAERSKNLNSTALLDGMRDGAAGWQ